MLPSDSGSDSTGRTAVDNQTVRNVYIVGPDKKDKTDIDLSNGNRKKF